MRFALHQKETREGAADPRHRIGQGGATVVVLERSSLDSAVLLERLRADADMRGLNSLWMAVQDRSPQVPRANCREVRECRIPVASVGAWGSYRIDLVAQVQQPIAVRGGAGPGEEVESTFAMATLASKCQAEILRSRLISKDGRWCTGLHLARPA